MSSASPPDYPFGIPPSDPFSVATCPACAARVGPALHYCPSCYATHDMTSARADILFRGGAEPTIVRVTQAGLAVIGVVLVVLGAAIGVSLLIAGGAAVAVSGALGWLAYPHYPRAVGVATATAVVLVAVPSALLALIATPGRINGWAVVGAIGAISLAVFRGAQAAWRVGERLSRLRLLAAGSARVA